MKNKIKVILLLCVMLINIFTLTAIADDNNIQYVSISFFDDNGSTTNQYLSAFDSVESETQEYSINTNQLKVDVITTSNDYAIKVYINDKEYVEEPYHNISELDSIDVKIVLEDIDGNIVQQEEMSFSRQSDTREFGLIGVNISSKDENDEVYDYDVILFEHNNTAQINLPYTAVEFTINDILMVSSYSEITIEDESGILGYVDEPLSIVLDNENPSYHLIITCELDGESKIYELYVEKDEQISDNTNINIIDVFYSSNRLVLEPDETLHITEELSKIEFIIPEGVEYIDIIAQPDSQKTKISYILNGQISDDCINVLSDTDSVIIQTTAESKDQQIYEVSLVWMDNQSLISKILNDKEKLIVYGICTAVALIVLILLIIIISKAVKKNKNKNK